MDDDDDDDDDDDEANRRDLSVSLNKADQKALVELLGSV